MQPAVRRAHAYLSRVVALPAAEAVGAFDACRRDLRVSAGTDRWILPLAGALLELWDPPAPDPTPRSAAPLRRAVGRLVAPGWRRVGVEIEVVPWSGTACELGLRPRGRPIVPLDLVGGRGFYFTAGAQAVGRLGRLMELHSGTISATRRAAAAGSTLDRVALSA